MSLLAGFLALALLGAAVGSPAQGGTTVAASNVKAGFGWLNTAIGKLVDPSIPAIAQRGSSSSSTAVKPASSTGPPASPATAKPSVTAPTG